MNYAEGSAALSQVKPCPPPSPVVSLIDQLRQAQNETHSLVGDLESRLSFVTLPAQDVCGNKAGPQPVSIESPICSELSVRIDVEGNIQARLRAILNALTV